MISIRSIYESMKEDMDKLIPPQIELKHKDLYDVKLATDIFYEIKNRFDVMVSNLKNIMNLYVSKDTFTVVKCIFDNEFSKLIDTEKELLLAYEKLKCVQQDWYDLIDEEFNVTRMVYIPQLNYRVGLCELIPNLWDNRGKKLQDLINSITCAWCYDTKGPEIGIPFMNDYKKVLELNWAPFISYNNV